MAKPALHPRLLGQAGKETAVALTPVLALHEGAQMLQLAAELQLVREGEDTTAEQDEAARRRLWRLGVVPDAEAAFEAGGRKADGEFGLAASAIWSRISGAWWRACGWVCWWSAVLLVERHFRRQSVNLAQQPLWDAPARCFPSSIRRHPRRHHPRRPGAGQAAGPHGR